jgi:dihydrofolate synthase/folylpolyglutamate synthase
MLASILQWAGYKTGLNTSPALVNVTERIRINGTDITEESFARLAAKVKEAEERSGKNYGGFDRMTACALLAFREEGVQTAVLETGLGGRRDAVTAVETRLTAITSISLDHMQYLGNTIESIAAEKCGILKPGIPVVCHPQVKEAEKVIREYAEKLGCEVIFTDPSDIEYFGCDNGLQHMKYAGIDIGLPLLGSHQRINAACAIELALQLRKLGLTITDEAIARGILNVRWNCRLEYLRGTYGYPDMLLDGAHNPDGMRTLAEAVKEFYSDRATVALMCVMKDKDIAGIAKEAAKLAGAAVCTAVNERSLDPQLLRCALEEAGVKAFSEPDVKAALRKAREMCPSGGLIVVAGSLFLAGEIRERVLGERD